jgi:predicted MFS family arabinose efflux permease
MRRPSEARQSNIVALVGAILLVDSVFYAAIVPILGDLSREFALSKGRAGLLVGMYAVGIIVAAYPSARAAARWSGRSCVIAGLATMSVGCLLFAFADETFGLLAARLIQGLGGALSWTGGLVWLAQIAPDGGRAKMLGTALGIGVFGSQLGPVIGVIAAEAGRAPAFASGALVGAVLGTLAVSHPESRGTKTLPSSSIRQMMTSDFRIGFWLTGFASACLGVVDVLTPLQLSDRGVAPITIGAIFFAASGLLAIVSRWTGAVIDRRGIALPVAVACVGSLMTMLALAVTGDKVVVAIAVVLGSANLGALWGPGTHLMSRAARENDVDESYAFGAFVLAWAIGFAIGSNTCGALADAGGQALPYLLACGLCGGTAAFGLARFLRRGSAPESKRAIVSLVRTNNHSR